MAWVLAATVDITRQPKVACLRYCLALILLLIVPSGRSPSIFRKSTRVCCRQWTVNKDHPGDAGSIAALTYGFGASVYFIPLVSTSQIWAPLGLRRQAHETEPPKGKVGNGSAADSEAQAQSIVPSAKLDAARTLYDPEPLLSPSPTSHAKLDAAKDFAASAAGAGSSPPHDAGAGSSSPSHGAGDLLSPSQTTVPVPKQAGDVHSPSQATVVAMPTKDNTLPGHLGPTAGGVQGGIHSMDYAHTGILGPPPGRVQGGYPMLSLPDALSAPRVARFQSPERMGTIGLANHLGPTSGRFTSAGPDASRMLTPSYSLVQHTPPAIMFGTSPRLRSSSASMDRRSQLLGPGTYHDGVEAAAMTLSRHRRPPSAKFDRTPRNHTQPDPAGVLASQASNPLAAIDKLKRRAPTAFIAPLPTSFPKVWIQELNDSDEDPQVAVVIEELNDSDEDPQVAVSYTLVEPRVKQVLVMRPPPERIPLLLEEGESEGADRASTVALPDPWSLDIALRRKKPAWVFRPLEAPNARNSLEQQRPLTVLNPQYDAIHPRIRGIPNFAAFLNTRRQADEKESLNALHHPAVSDYNIMAALAYIHVYEYVGGKIFCLLIYPLLMCRRQADEKEHLQALHHPAVSDYDIMAAWRQTDKKERLRALHHPAVGDCDIMAAWTYIHVYERQTDEKERLQALHHPAVSDYDIMAAWRQTDEKESLNALHQPAVSDYDIMAAWRQTNEKERLQALHHPAVGDYNIMAAWAYIHVYEYVGGMLLCLLIYPLLMCRRQTDEKELYTIQLRQTDEKERLQALHHPAVGDYDIMAAWNYIQKHVPIAAMSALWDRWQRNPVAVILEGGDEAILEISRAIDYIRPKPATWTHTAVDPNPISFAFDKRVGHEFPLDLGVDDNGDPILPEGAVLQLQVEAAKETTLPRRVKNGAMNLNTALGRDDPFHPEGDGYGALTQDIGLPDTDLDLVASNRHRTQQVVLTGAGHLPPAPDPTPEEAKLGPGVYFEERMPIPPLGADAPAADFTRLTGRPEEDPYDNRMDLDPNHHIGRPSVPSAIIFDNHEKEKLKPNAPRPPDFNTMPGRPMPKQAYDLLDYHVEDIPLSVLAGHRAPAQPPSFKVMQPNMAVVPLQPGAEMQPNDESCMPKSAMHPDTSKASGGINVKRLLPIQETVSLWFHPM
eukprot:gene32244-16809_t